MPLFGENRVAFSYDILREGEEITLMIDCESYSQIPSLEDDPITMGKTIDILIEVKTVTNIVFKQKRDYEYEYSQTILLMEIAKIYDQLLKRKDLFGYSSLVSDPGCTKCIAGWYAEMRHIISDMLRSDPIGAYVQLKRVGRRERIKLDKISDERCIKCENKFISIVDYISDMLDKTKLLTLAKPYLAGYKVGDREIYRRIFRPLIKPDFLFTKLMSTYPIEGEELDSYSVGDTEVAIFSMPETIQYLYHMMPPEFKLSEEEYEIYTVGFGLIEVLLEGDKIQDITVNSPMGEMPIFIVHQEFDDCRTNIIPTRAESESWASKMRLISGRPLDEANPILDTELTLPTARARVGVISEPLNPNGLAYAFRRHRDKPWTLPLFIKNKMISPLAAGVLSFIIDGSRTILVAGTRSAGKSSLLGSLLTEIMRKYRIITIEDTLELPVDALRKMGYNIQPMKVASAMSKGTTEVPADEGIRTTLRLGDSSLIVGEVRSTEAKALYEAMRVGALANVVAGTIHGDSPYGVFDRVVNDLEVPRTSFKATDIIVVANPIRSADGLHRWRRVTSITEVRKKWGEDPLLEGGFVDLMRYNSHTDQLEPTTDLINGEIEVIKAIAGNVKDWAGNWDAVWDNILLRTKIKETLFNVAEKIKSPELLEANFVVLSNDEFHRASDKIKEEVGSLDSKRIFLEWNSWLKREIKKKGKTI